MHCSVAVILGDLGPEQKQERETDGKVFHPCLHMQIAASFSTVAIFVQNDQIFFFSKLALSVAHAQSM